MIDRILTDILDGVCHIREREEAHTAALDGLTEVSESIQEDTHAIRELLEAPSGTEMHDVLNAILTLVSRIDERQEQMVRNQQQILFEIRELNGRPRSNTAA